MRVIVLIISFCFLTTLYAFTGETVPNGLRGNEKFDFLPGKIALESDSFFILAAKSGFEAAINYITETGPMSNLKKDIESLTKEINKITSNYGNMQSWEFVNLDIGDDLNIKLEYNCFYTDSAMQWELTYTLSPDYKWILRDICFNSNFECIHLNVNKLLRTNNEVNSALRTETVIDEYEKFITFSASIINKELNTKSSEPIPISIQYLTAYTIRLITDLENLSTQFTPDQKEKLKRITEKAMQMNNK